MQIELTKEQEERLQTQVAAGRLASLDEAIAEAIDLLKEIDEGLAELDRGETIAAEEAFANRRALAAEDLERWRGFAPRLLPRAT